MKGYVFFIPLLLATLFWKSFRAQAFLPQIVSFRKQKGKNASSYLYPRRLLSGDNHLSKSHPLGNYIEKMSILQMQEDDDDENFGPQSCNVLGTTLSCCCDNVRQSGIGTGKYMQYN